MTFFEEKNCLLVIKSSLFLTKLRPPHMLPVSNTTNTAKAKQKEFYEIGVSVLFSSISISGHFWWWWFVGTKGRECHAHFAPLKCLFFFFAMPKRLRRCLFRDYYLFRHVLTVWHCWFNICLLMLMFRQFCTVEDF